MASIHGSHALLICALTVKAIDADLVAVVDLATETCELDVELFYVQIL
jgi:hypothetical protein